MLRVLSCLTAGLIGVSLVGSPAIGLAQQSGRWQTYGTENGEWRSYGGNIASQKYSPLDQIDAGNFSDLEIAWRWRRPTAASPKKRCRAGCAPGTSGRASTPGTSTPCPTARMSSGQTPG